MAARESSQERLRIDVSGPTALGDAVAWARRYALDQGLGPRDLPRLAIIIEELITNLCEHGVCVPEREIGLELARLDSTVELVIEDNGAPFDPRSASSQKDVPERGGGAGLRMVAAWSEIVGYHSNAGRNRLELLMRLADS